MKLIVPSYFNLFRCIASECRDSCCVGWDIALDKRTEEKYKALNGALGRRVQKSIYHSDGGAYIEMKDGRCPFLSECGLCDLICEYGEEILSDICREHPRFYTVLGDVAYGGVGLSCEAAARLILTEESHTYSEREIGREYEECDEELHALVMSRRSGLIGAILGASDLRSGIRALMGQLLALQSEIDGGLTNDFCIQGATYELFEAYSELEYMGDKLLADIGRALPMIDKMKLGADGEAYLSRIGVYLIDRYLPYAVEDGNAIGVGVLILCSLAALALLFAECDELTLDRAIDISILYSKEIEYCEENVAAIREWDLSLAQSALGIIDALTCG